MFLSSVFRLRPLPRLRERGYDCGRDQGLGSATGGVKTGMQRKVTIVNELGLHARSAGLIAKLAAKAKSRVWLERAGNRADAASILDILTLECSRGKP